MMKKTFLQRRQIVYPAALVLAAICLLIGLRSCGKEQPADATGIEFMMDTVVEQCWYGEDAEEAYQRVSRVLHQMEQELSPYLEESEIAQLNAAAGHGTVQLSDETYELLKRSVSLCEQTGGLFDITIKPLVDLWDVTGESPVVPTDSQITEKKQLVGYRQIILNDERKTAMLSKEGMAVDLGAIAKGAAADRAREAVSDLSVSGYISIGGNLMVVGKKPNGKDFVMGIRDPRGEANEYIASLEMDGYCMSTTGDYERYFMEDGVRYHHIIDPFTGKPSDSDLISVTVLSRDGTMADFLSTYLFLLGTDGLSEHLDEKEYWVVAVDKDKNVYMSAGMGDWVKPNSQKGDYHWMG